MGSDPMLSLLKDFKYNVVRLPRTDIRPMQVLEKQGNSLAVLGDLGDFFDAGSVPLPQVGPDQQAAFIEGKRSNSLKLSVGLSLLGGIIGAMTGTQAKLAVGFEKASNLVFHFEDVKVNNVKPVDVSKFLLAASIAQSGFAQQIMDDELYVINSTIKSAKFTTEALNSSGKSVDVDVPVIQQAVSGSVGVKTDGSNQSKVTFEGTTPLVFGIQALRMEFENGKFARFKAVDATSTGLREIGGDDETELETLETDGPFVNLA